MNNVYDKYCVIDLHELNDPEFYKINILKECFIEKYKDFIWWDYVSQFQSLSEDFIDKYYIFIEFDNLSLNKKIKLSNEFIKKYKDRFSYWGFSNLFVSNLFSEDFIIENESKYDAIAWENISEYQILSNNFITKYIDKLDIYLLLNNKKLDQEFVEKLALLK